jgi:hypothetical protein
MGYVHCEKQQKDWTAELRKAFNADSDVIRARHMNELEQERNVIRELEISLLKAGEAIELEIQDHAKTERNRVISDGYRKAIVNLMFINHLWDFNVHRDDPTNMLHILMEDAEKRAIDPALNQKAKNLFVKGVRKGAKQGREQMRKLMHKSIDNQATVIQYLQAELDNAVAEIDGLLIRRTRFRDAVMNVLDDKIALPGVRRAIKTAITTEVSRLRAVETNKGE